MGALKYTAVCFLLLGVIPHVHSQAQTRKAPAILFLKPDKFFQGTAQNSPILKFEPVKHEAFFCKLEDRMYSKINIWVKFRAGSDEIYRQQIATPYVK